MQLYSLLESIQLYFKNLSEVHIIYRSSTDEFDKAYSLIKSKFNNYIFHKQSDQPELDFKPLIMESTFESPSSYVMFAVDDMIVKDYVDLNECINALKTSNAYGFYLRLGKNINECYILNTVTPVPNHFEIQTNIFQYQFSDGLGDWGYPNTVDMTIYKKSDIKEAFEKIPYFYNPTYLEGWWASYPDMNKKGLFFQESKVVNVPLNIVTRDANSKNMNISLQDLLEKFNQGLKIDISKYHKINNVSPHREYTPEFIIRD